MVETVLFPTGDRGDKMRPFLSRLAQRRLGGLTPTAIEPALESLNGAVMWTDVTGFTAVAERLSSRGASGAERLSEALDSCYASILEVVEQTGGDVQFFAGDGALVLWPAASPVDLPAATAKAVSAAQRLCAQVLPASRTTESPLQLRAAVGAGQLSAATLGGVTGHWCHLVGGDAVRQVALAITTVAPGVAAMSAQASTLLSSWPPEGSRPRARDTT